MIAIVLVSAVLGSASALFGATVGLTLERNRSTPVRMVFGSSAAILIGCLYVLFNYY